MKNLRRFPLLLAACIGLPAAVTATTTPESTGEPKLNPHQTSAASPGAPPGMRRCLAADGSILVTDHACDAQGAKEVVAPKDAPPPPPVTQILRVRSCARNQSDLLLGVRDALEARDANRFADYYHWAGMSTAEGYRVMERLGAFIARPLLDVQLVYSSELRPAGADEERAPAQFRTPVPRLSFDPGLGSTTDPTDPDAEPAKAPPPRPADLLRVDQLRSDKDLDSQVTYLHLRNNAGCWWLQF